jgi:hypothetical protein
MINLGLTIDHPQTLMYKQLFNSNYNVLNRLNFTFDVIEEKRPPLVN